MVGLVRKHNTKTNFRDRAEKYFLIHISLFLMWYIDLKPVIKPRKLHEKREPKICYTIKPCWDEYSSNGLFLRIVKQFNS